MSGRIIFYCADGLTIGDICILFGENVNAYGYEIAHDAGGVIVIREGK